MKKPRLVVVGNGMAGIRTLEEVRNRVVAPSDTPPRSALQPPPTS